MDALKPCPFCGGKASMVHSVYAKRLDESIMLGVLVKCGTCSATVIKRTDEEVTNEWNRRVGE